MEKKEWKDRDRKKREGNNRKNNARDWLESKLWLKDMRSLNGSPECIASLDKDEERSGSGAFTKMESEREQSKRFALDKLLFLCCWSRFYINGLLYQVSVLFKSSLGGVQRALCRVDSPYFVSNFFDSPSFLGLGSHLFLLLPGFFVDLCGGKFDF